MSEEPADLNPEEETNPDVDDWENRVLCRDESCIGVVGPDGRCKECGKLFEVPQTGTSDTSQTDSEPADETVEHKKDWAVDDWENRTLCSDESCIGVIGPDGRCKECGQPYEG